MTKPTCIGPLLLLYASVTAAAAAPDTITVGADGPAAHFSAPGQVRAVRQAELAAQAGGRITAVLVRSGELVRQGQVLLRIDAPAARAAAEAGAAQARAADVQLASARGDFERAQRLHDKQYLSDAALQRAAAQLQAVEAQATATRAQARASRAIAGWEELRSPYDGRVTSVGVAVGDLASPGQRLVGVYAPGAMRVLADVPEDIAARLAIDRPARLAFDAGGCAGAPAAVQTWTLLSAVDPVSRSVGVRVELPPVAACIPGTLVRVDLPLRAVQPQLAIPRSALVRRGELDAAYVVDTAGRVRLRQLRLGEAAGDSVAVLAGLEPGERVLREAARYRPAEPSATDSP